MTDKDLSKMSSDELTRARYELIQELSKFEVELEERRKQNRVHVMASEIKLRAASETLPTQMAAKFANIIAPELGFDTATFVVFMGEMPPKQMSGAYHRHGEAVKYYPSGKAVEIVGDKEYQVGPGDFVFVPSHIWHGTQNPYDEPVRFLAVAQLTGNHTPKAAPYVSKTGW